jgi:hypothetical protein
MTGGTIDGNTATADGGGVYAVTGNPNNPAIFNMSGTAVVSGNNAVNGGGVFVHSTNKNNGIFTMSGGTLRGNTATNNGGGVFLNNARTYFYMKGGSIEGNSAVSGGGVYVAAGTFTKADADDSDSGTIYGDTNTTHTAGGTENTASGGSGHAAWVNNTNPTKKRDATADGEVGLNSGDTTNWDQ